MRYIIGVLVTMIASFGLYSFSNDNNDKMEGHPTIGTKAPAWQIKGWINGTGKDTTDLQISDFEGKVVYLKLFKYGCPGCHSVGFPTLQKVYNEYKNDSQVQLLGVQTAFSGKSYNSYDKLAVVQGQYNLDIPFGHDPGPSEDEYPDILVKYQTRGTPWVIIIDKKGVIRYSDFKIDHNQAVQLIDELKSEE